MSSRREWTLIDVNGAWLAGFIEIDDLILGWPTYGLFYFYDAHGGNPPFMVQPGQRFNHKGFLDLIAKIAKHPQHPAFCYELERRGPGAEGGRIQITTAMRAADLAKVTGFPIEEVRELLADHLTFEQAS